jgi:hypothetical protein
MDDRGPDWLGDFLDEESAALGTALRPSLPIHASPKEEKA